MMRSLQHLGSVGVVVEKWAELFFILKTPQMVWSSGWASLFKILFRTPQLLTVKGFKASSFTPTPNLRPPPLAVPRRAVMMRADDGSRHDQQQMHSLIPCTDSNGDKWTSREATEGVTHLYSSKFSQMCAFVCVFMSSEGHVPAASGSAGLNKAFYAFSRTWRNTRKRQHTRRRAHVLFFFSGDWSVKKITSSLSVVTTPWSLRRGQFIYPEEGGNLILLLFSRKRQDEQPFIFINATRNSEWKQKEQHPPAGRQKSVSVSICSQIGVLDHSKVYFIHISFNAFAYY